MNTALSLEPILGRRRGASQTGWKTGAKNGKIFSILGVAYPPRSRYKGCNEGATSPPPNTQAKTKTMTPLPSTQTLRSFLDSQVIVPQWIWETIDTVDDGRDWNQVMVTVTRFSALGAQYVTGFEIN